MSSFGQEPTFKESDVQNLFIFTAFDVHVKGRLAAVERLPLYRLYNVLSFWTIESVKHFENRSLLKTVLKT